MNNNKGNIGNLRLKGPFEPPLKQNLIANTARKEVSLSNFGKSTELCYGADDAITFRSSNPSCLLCRNQYVFKIYIQNLNCLLSRRMSTPL